MREKMERFMSGRYGVDELSRFMLGVTAVLCVLSLIFRSSLLNLLVFVAIILIYVRMLSRNFARRNSENEVYLKYQNKVTGFFKKQKYELEQRKVYHIYRCPGCKQKIRIPRGKGKIEITCPKCRTSFVKKS